MSGHQLKTTHFDLKSLAKTLKLTSIDIIQTSNQDIESHWFRSLGPADLYYWKAKNRIVKQQVSIFNQVVEWNEYDGVKTGYVNDDDFHREKSEVICFDQEINAEVIHQAIEFIAHAKNIKEETAQELISHYQFYNRWEQFNPMRLVRFLVACFSKKATNSCDDPL